MNRRTKQNIIKASFLCGLATFLINTLFSFIGDISLILILTNILPGFLYGIALCTAQEHSNAWKRVLFIFCSGALFILMAWTATDIHLPFQGHLSFVLASLAGVYGLLLLYRFLLGQALVAWKAFLYATLTGIISAILPAEAYYARGFNSSLGTPYETIIIMSIFLTWQTLFGLTITLSSSSATNMNCVKNQINFRVLRSSN